MTTLLDRLVRIKRLKKYDGQWSFNKDIIEKDGSCRNATIVWTFEHDGDNRAPTFDVDSVTYSGSEEDVYWSIPWKQRASIHNTISHIISKWARQVGVKHPFLNRV